MADVRKTVLITGCAPGGIGHSLATDFHKAGKIGAYMHFVVVANRDVGLRVFATARDAAVLADLAALGIETISFDVTSKADRLRVRETLEKEANGKLDILVNNA